MASIRDSADDYLTTLRVERGLSQNTLEAYRRDLAQYLRFLGGRTPDPALVSSYVSELRRRKLAPSTINRKMAVVRGFHRFRLAEGLAGDDPTALVDLARLPDAIPKALEVDEAIRLVEAPDRSTVAGRRDAALLEFLYGTGCRVSEAVELDLSDLDLDDRIVRVTGKGAKQRLVPIGTAAVDRLYSWLADRLELVKGRTDAVFLNLRGGRLTRQGAYLIVRQTAARAGIAPDRISPHVLRHSAATHMIEGGADLRTVQEMLGHANLSTTQVYTRVSPQHLLEVFVQAHPRSR
jgi:integrase/recombinase XerD